MATDSSPDPPDSPSGDSPNPLDARSGPLFDDRPDADFVPIFDLDEVEPGQSKAAAVNGRMVAVFNEGGVLKAIDDMCPHMGASLSEGHFENGEVLCPWHAWRFSLDDGSWLDSDKDKVRCGSYAVRVIDDEICVYVPDREPAAN